MKFEEFPLNVPDIKKISKKLNGLIDTFAAAKTAQEANAVMKRINKYAEDIMTDMTVIEVRYTIDTNNADYEKAQAVVDEVGPQVSALFNRYNKLLVASPFRSELEKIHGSYLFKMIENNLKTFDDKIIEDLQKQNRLTNAYSKLIASAQIEFNGGVYTLAQLGKFMQDTDRETRKNASKAYFGYYEKNEAEIARIYDELVKLRDGMAKKLGFNNYLELGYLRLGRLDYDAKMVEGYRNQILDEVVPVSNKLHRRQSKRIGISQPNFYDWSLSFLSGNPTPKGNRDFLVEQAQVMYKEMSPETDEFFSFMVKSNLLDLEAKPGKQAGGYMTYFPRYKAPFIFANFNGTSHDVDVLTHEVGHAFQGYESRNIKVPEYRQPTLESCEIHSMSMEFFAAPWIGRFFKEDEAKYLFSHLEGAINFLPYGVTVDEFQAYVYTNPQATHEERCAKWREIEQKYTPFKKYKGFPFLEKGTYWLRQTHIFSSPLYYIDYTLAQVVAFQFAVEMRKNREKAWKKYVKLCRLGGRYPFVTLLEHAKLRNPFIEGNIKKVIRPLAKELAKTDDSKF